MAPEPEASPDVACLSLTRRYGATEVLAALDVTFAGGRTTALVGPSGCGKSTLLRLIAGLDAPDAGSVTIGTAAPAAVRASGGLAMAFQDPSLLPWRTARGNVALAQRLARQPVDRAAIDRLLTLVGLDGFFDARPGALSGGMRQRAAIARCLATRPRLLLLDEPFGAVDELTRRQLARDLSPLWRAQGTTTLLVTHSVTEAVMLADRVLVFSPRPARLVADIPVAFAHPRTAATAASAAFAAALDQVTDALAWGDADRPSSLAAQ